MRMRVSYSAYKRLHPFAGCLAFTLLFLLLTGVLHAQDTLIMTDGTERHVKVTEIGEHNLSYRNTGNTDGPVYTIGLSKVFMAVYKGGRRESFTTVTAAPPPSPAGVTPQSEGIATGTAYTLHNDIFEVRLVSTKVNPDKRNKATSVSASVEVYSNGAKFTTLSVYTYQRKDLADDYEMAKSGYYYGSYISVSTDTKSLQEFLFNKYESYTGKGFGWALPPGFFTPGITGDACTVAFLEQKFGNKEILGSGGISHTKMNLQDGSSIEGKLLSVCLLWLGVNFGKK